MTGCRLLRSTGLSCKCFSIAVRCGLWIWNLLKVLHTVIHWRCNHPPFGEHGPASGDGAESGARRWRAGQTVALKQVRVGDLVLPSYAEYASLRLDDGVQLWGEGSQYSSGAGIVHFCRQGQTPSLGL